MKKVIFLFFISIFSNFAQQIDWIKQLKNKPFTDPREFIFSITSGYGVSGDLSIAGPSKVLTFINGPRGVWGSNINHYLYISGGTGTAEAVLITGGTCSSVVTTNCLIVVTTLQTHTGSWTVSSASVGIQEAIWFAGSSGHVHIINGQYQTYATIYVPSSYSHFSLSGDSMHETMINYTPTNGYAFVWGATLNYVSMHDIGFSQSSIATSGSTVLFERCFNGNIRNIYVAGGYIGVTFTSPNNTLISNIWTQNQAYIGQKITTDTIYSGAGLFNNIFTSTQSTGLAGMQITSGGAPIVGPRFNNCDFNGGIYGLEILVPVNAPINEGVITGGTILGTQIGLRVHGMGAGAYLYGASNWHLTQLLYISTNGGAGVAGVGVLLDSVANEWTFLAIPIMTTGTGITSFGVELRGAKQIHFLNCDIDGGLSPGSAAAIFIIEDVANANSPVLNLTVRNCRLGYSLFNNGSGVPINAVYIGVGAHSDIWFSSNQIRATEAGISYYAYTVNGGARNLFLGNTFRTGTDMTAPTCDESLRGSDWFIEGAAGVADSKSMCVKDTDNSYSWVTMY